MLACIRTRRRLGADCRRLVALLDGAHGDSTWHCADRADRTAQASASPAGWHDCAWPPHSLHRLQMFSTRGLGLAPDAPGPEQEQAAHPLWNWPNAVSGARLLSGPAIAYLIASGEWPAAFVSLGLAGASDWLDGFLARRLRQGSVVGSYLDPLADKALICCTAGALAWEGSLSWPLVALIIGRDVLLVAGAFGLRLRSLGWRWPGWQEFFRTVPAPAPDSSAAAGSGLGPASPPAQAQARPPGRADSGRARAPEAGAGRAQAPQAAGGRGPSAAGAGGGRAQPPRAAGRPAAQPAPFVRPLYVSKVNTVAQLGLVAACISNAWYGWPPEPALLGLGGLAGGLTLASGWAYWRQHRPPRASGSRP